MSAVVGLADRGRVAWHMLSIAPGGNTDNGKAIGFDDDDIVFQLHGSSVSIV